MSSLTDCDSEDEDLFDQLSDEIDYSAIGEVEWDIYETQSQPPIQGQSQATSSSSTSTLASANLTDPDSQSPRGPSSSHLDSAQNQSLLPLPSVSSSTASSPYDVDDYGDVNEEFYAELDELERNYSERERAHGVSMVQSNSDVSREEKAKGMSERVSKRTLSDSPDTETSRRKKLKENESGSDPERGPGVPASALEAFEEEMCCPICCEIVVYAHAVNPCGHVLCGCCGASWFIDNRKHTCPMCRSETESHRPMIPNVTIDGVARKYLNLRILAGHDGEEELEKLKKDFDAREYKWKLQERRVREEFDRRSRIVASGSVALDHVGPLPWWRGLNRPGP